MFDIVEDWIPKIKEKNDITDDELYQVKSSTDTSKSYMVEKDSCDCLGFKNFYKFHHGKGLKANCSHIEAVRIFKK